MLRLSKLADYAVVVLVRLSRDKACQTCACIATDTGVPEPTVAKVLKALAAGGLVTSQRGARGGYRLARALASISVADVVGAIDGPIAIAACVDGSDHQCAATASCPCHRQWDPVNHAVVQALTRISLAEMTGAASRPAPVALPAE